ncbi:hypothetical protein PIIN_09970 [Serendipita indica DSM 11827]|uniref:Uncharacterized protein n=1 Tax=Serendipita indica (strain DSM 11827) TaxID=1109443 RepID=G4U2G2_SERID|nr:hypothetical protein PIIN_09970 [Serendipita indica DSM 11827]
MYLHSPFYSTPSTSNHSLVLSTGTPTQPTHNDNLEGTNSSAPKKLPEDQWTATKLANLFCCKQSGQPLSDDDANLLQGVMDVLPDHWHSLMIETKSCQIFLDKINQFRSNTINVLRKNTIHLLPDSPDFTSVDREAMRTPAGRKTNMYILQALAYNKNPKDGDPVYPLVCPVIGFGRTLYRTFPMDQIFKLVLYGADALRKPVTNPASQSNYRRWKGLFTVTPSTLATCAVLARFAYSADTKFQRVGDQTLIGWEDDWSEYLTNLLGHRQLNDITSHFSDLLLDTLASRSQARTRPAARSRQSQFDDAMNEDSLDQSPPVQHQQGNLDELNRNHEHHHDSYGDDNRSHLASPTAASTTV